MRYINQKMRNFCFDFPVPHKLLSFDFFTILKGKQKGRSHTLDISVEKKQVTLQQRSQHSQQNYHENLGLRKTLHPPKSTRLKLP